MRNHYSSYQRKVRAPKPALDGMGSRNVVLIDMEPLLRQEREQCEAASAELEALQMQLAEFREKVEPAYSKWFYGLFGERITRLRELDARAQELKRTVIAVETEALLAKCSHKKAYARLEKVRLGAEKIEEMRAKQEEASRSACDDSEQASPDLSGDLPPEVEEFLKMGFEQIFGRGRFSPKEEEQFFERFKTDFREQVLGGKEREEPKWERQERKARSTRRPAVKETSEGRAIKALYRDLARRLHPDLNSLSQKELDLWHEVRAAYLAKNLEALETLAAILENGGSAGFRHVQCLSRIRAILRDILKKRKNADRAIRAAKKEVAWGFLERQNAPGKLQHLENKIRRDLAMDERELASEIEDCEWQISRWKTERKPRSGRKKITSSPF